MGGPGRGSGGGPLAPARTTRPEPADRRALHGELEHRAGPRRFEGVRACYQIVTGDRPTVPPQQRPDIEHADAAAIEIRLVMHRDLLHAVPEIEQPEMPGPT